MKSFAEVSDYVKRYGEVEDEARVEVLLQDATNYLLSLYREAFGEDYQDGKKTQFDNNATAVTCAIVARSLNVPTGMEGITQTSQTAGSYSASYTFSNPSGDFYLTKADKSRLGLTIRAYIGSIPPLIGKDRDNETISN